MPKTRIRTRIIGIGSKTSVQPGMNWNTGIKEKNTATSTRAKSPIAAVATTGKNSLFVLNAVIIPELDVRLPSPPEVPLTKIWYNIIPVIK